MTEQRKLAVLAGALAPTAVLALDEMVRGRRWLGARQTTVLVGFHQLLALAGLRRMRAHGRRLAGVRRTATRNFERLGFVGSAVYSFALWRHGGAPMLKLYALLHTIFSLLFAQFVYVGMLHNQGLSDPNERYTQKIVHWPSMLGFLPAAVATLAVWMVDSRELLLRTSGDANEVVRVLGFWLFSAGILDAGYRSAASSVPALEPTDGVIALALAYCGIILAHLPRILTSSRSRLYIAGYLSMVLSLFMIASVDRRQPRQLAAL